MQLNLPVILNVPVIIIYGCSYKKYIICSDLTPVFNILLFNEQASPEYFVTSQSDFNISVHTTKRNLCSSYILLPLKGDT